MCATEREKVCIKHDCKWLCWFLMRARGGISEAQQHLEQIKQHLTSFLEGMLPWFQGNGLFVALKTSLKRFKCLGKCGVVECAGGQV